MPLGGAEIMVRWQGGSAPAREALRREVGARMIDRVAALDMELWRVSSSALGHGTHVVGILAAHMNNSKGIAGIAPGVRIMPVRVFSGYVGTYYDLIRGIVYAVDSGARIINFSLGATTYSRGEAWP